MASAASDGAAVSRNPKFCGLLDPSRSTYRKMLRNHVRNLDLILDGLDRALLKYRTAWKNLGAVYNGALSLRAIFRRTIDMLEPHGGVEDQPAFRFELLPAVALLSTDDTLRLTHLCRELNHLLDDKRSSIMRRRLDLDADASWNHSYLEPFVGRFAMEHDRLEAAMLSIKFTEFVSTESLYDSVPGTGSASHPLPYRKKKRKQKANLKDRSAELDEALQQKDFRAIAGLLAEGADPDVPLKDGHALICHAVQPEPRNNGGSACLVRLLAKYGADPDVRDDKSIAPLHFASQLGTTAAGLALLEMGADVHIRQFQGVQPLALAAAWKRTTLVLHLLARRADPNDVDELGITPLGTTILTRLPPVSREIIKLLLAYGARVTAPSAAISPVHEAILRRSSRDVARLLEVSRHLVDHPCRVGLLDSTPNITPLYLAIHTGHFDSVRILLRAGADVSRTTRFGERRDTYAIRAIESGAGVATLRALLDAGADPNEPNETGRTPLHVAAELAHGAYAEPVEVRLLLAHGADVHATTHTNANVPLHMAVRAARADVVAALLDDGAADINAPLRSGATPFMLAAFRGSLNMLRFLHRRGARTDTVLDIGETAMHGAARRGDVPCADFLRRLGLDVGASPSAPTGFAPLHAAACRGQDAMIRWLVGQGADPAARMDTAWIGQCLGKTAKKEDVGSGSVADVARAFGHAKVAEYIDEVVASRRENQEGVTDDEGLEGGDAGETGGAAGDKRGSDGEDTPAPTQPLASVPDDL